MRLAKRNNSPPSRKANLAKNLYIVCSSTKHRPRLYRICSSKSSRRQSRTPGKPKPIGRRYDYQSANWRNPPAFIQPFDQEILRDLMGLRAMHFYGSSEILTHDRGEVVLRKILSTGRCVWGEGDLAISTWSEPKPGRFRWKAVDEQGLKLELVLDGGADEVQIGRASRPLFIDTKNGVIGPLNAVDPVSWTETGLT